MSSPQIPNQPAQKKSNLGKGLIIGCLGALFIAALVLGGGVFWLYRSGIPFITEKARDAFVQSIEETKIPDDQKQGIVTQVNRLTDAVKEGRVDVDRLGQVVERVSKSPIFSAIVVEGVAATYLASSGLSPDERESARTTLHRFARGVFEGRIPEEQAEAALDLVSDPSAEPGGRELATTLTDEQLKLFLEEAKSAADAAGISEEPQAVDFAAEFKRIVDQILNETTAPREIDPSTN